MALRSLNHDFIVHKALALILRLSCCLHFVENLQNWCLQRFLYGNNSVNREVVSTTHPLTDFGFTLTQHHCKVFLAKATSDKNLMNPVNDLE